MSLLALLWGAARGGTPEGSLQLFEATWRSRGLPEGFFEATWPLREASRRVRGRPRGGPFKRPCGYKATSHSGGLHKEVPEATWPLRETSGGVPGRGRGPGGLRKANEPHPPVGLCMQILNIIFVCDI